MPRKLQKYARIHVSVRDVRFHKVGGPVLLFIGMKCCRDQLFELNEMLRRQRIYYVETRVEKLMPVFRRIGLSAKTALELCDVLVWFAQRRSLEKILGDCPLDDNVLFLLARLEEAIAAEDIVAVKQHAMDLAIALGFYEHYRYLLRYRRLYEDGRVERVERVGDRVDEGRHSLLQIFRSSRRL